MESKQTNPILIQDNKADALLIQEKASSVPYISVDTVNGSEKIDLGNGTTNPPVTILGSVGLVVDGDIGVKVASPEAAVDISSGVIALQLGADGGDVTRTDEIAKTSRIVSKHYTNSKDPIGMIQLDCGGTASHLRLGGGSSSSIAATYQRFFTGAGVDTGTGTERMVITPDGDIGINTGVPAHKLDISGGTENEVLRLTSDDTGCYMLFEDNLTDPNNVSIGASANALRLQANVVEASVDLTVAGAFACKATRADIGAGPATTTIGVTNRFMITIEPSGADYFYRMADGVYNGQMVHLRNKGAITARIQNLLVDDGGTGITMVAGSKLLIIWDETDSLWYTTG